MKKKRSVLKHFISESIIVAFIEHSRVTKSPPCPDRFKWREEVFTITKCLSEWKDYTRKDKMTHNMQPQHTQIAEQRGIWGVGRFYFEAKTDIDRNFRLYYDRASKNAHDRDGSWILLAELNQEIS